MDIALQFFFATVPQGGGGGEEGGAPVQSADRHTPNKLFLHQSETRMGETRVRTGVSRDNNNTRGEGGRYVMRRVMCSR